MKNIPHTLHCFEADRYIIENNSARQLFQAIFNSLTRQIRNNLNNLECDLTLSNEYLAKVMRLHRNSIINLKKLLCDLRLITVTGTCINVELQYYLSLVYLLTNIFDDKESRNKFSRAVFDNDMQTLEKLGYRDLNVNEEREMLMILLFHKCKDKTQAQTESMDCTKIVQSTEVPSVDCTKIVQSTEVPSEDCTKIVHCTGLSNQNCTNFVQLPTSPVEFMRQILITIGKMVQKDTQKGFLKSISVPEDVVNEITLDDNATEEDILTNLGLWGLGVLIYDYLRTAQKLCIDCTKIVQLLEVIGSDCTKIVQPLHKNCAVLSEPCCDCTKFVHFLEDSCQECTKIVQRSITSSQLDDELADTAQKLCNHCTKIVQPLHKNCAQNYIEGEKEKKELKGSRRLPYKGGEEKFFSEEGQKGQGNGGTEISQDDQEKVESRLKVEKGKEVEEEKFFNGGLILGEGFNLSGGLEISQPDEKFLDPADLAEETGEESDKTEYPVPPNEIPSPENDRRANEYIRSRSVYKNKPYIRKGAVKEIVRGFVNNVVAYPVEFFINRFWWSLWEVYRYETAADIQYVDDDGKEVEVPSEEQDPFVMDGMWWPLKDVMNIARNVYDDMCGYFGQGFFEDEHGNRIRFHEDMTQEEVDEFDYRYIFDWELMTDRDNVKQLKIDSGRFRDIDEEDIVAERPQVEDKDKTTAENGALWHMLQGDKETGSPLEEVLRDFVKAFCVTDKDGMLDYFTDEGGYEIVNPMRLPDHLMRGWCFRQGKVRVDEFTSVFSRPYRQVDGLETCLYLFSARKTARWNGLNGYKDTLAEAALKAEVEVEVIDDEEEQDEAKAE